MLWGGGTHCSAHGPFLLSPLSWCPEQQAEAHSRQDCPYPAVSQTLVSRETAELSAKPSGGSPCSEPGFVQGTLEQTQHGALTAVNTEEGFLEKGMMKGKVLANRKWRETGLQPVKQTLSCVGSGGLERVKSKGPAEGLTQPVEASASSTWATHPGHHCYIRETGQEKSRHVLQAVSGLLLFFF